MAEQVASGGWTPFLFRQNSDQYQATRTSKSSPPASARRSAQTAVEHLAH